MVDRVCVPLAEGFEEAEAAIVIDLLRRAGVEVIVAGIGGELIEGSHGIAIQAEISIEKVKADDLDAIVLPGGMPGALNLKNSPHVKQLIESLAHRGAPTCAICAAPTVLEYLGLLEGREATCFPALQNQLASARVSTERVVVDGPVVTSQGLGTAVEFSLKLVELWRGAEAARELAERIVAGKGQGG